MTVTCEDMIMAAASQPGSPCWATVQLLRVEIEGKAWASAKAPAWETDLEQSAAQTSENGFEGAVVRSLWWTLRSAPHMSTWTLALAQTAGADTSRAPQGLRQKGLGWLGRRKGKQREGRESRGRRDQQICCGPGALVAAAVLERLRWLKNVGRIFGGQTTPPLGFWRVCMHLSAPAHDALC